MRLRALAERSAHRNILTQPLEVVAAAPAAPAAPVQTLSPAASPSAAQPFTPAGRTQS